MTPLSRPYQIVSSNSMASFAIATSKLSGTIRVFDSFFRNSLALLDIFTQQHKLKQADPQSR